ncbi:MAG: hypothetical protein ABI896_03230 [Actinomycetota bacterium]
MLARLRLLAFGGLIVVLLVGCGGSKKSDSSNSDAEVQAACSGAPLSAAPNLPSKFPTFDSVTYTKEATQGPTQIVEGYFEGDVKAAHDEVKAAFERAGYSVLFDEVEEHDSEVSWKGQGRSGQVALRDECGDSNRTFVHITNRPA